MKTKLHLRVVVLLSYFFLQIVPVHAQYNPDAPWVSNSRLSKSSDSDTPKFKDVVTSFNAYWEGKDATLKGSGHKPFMRWKEFHQNSVLPDGTLPTPSFLWEMWKQKQQMGSAQKAEVSSWTPMGPFDHNPENSWSPGQGRINVGIVDPNNPTIMYVGAPAGGIWKSIDSGEHWEPLSDYLPQIGVSGIAIDYNNSDIIYISTGDDDSRDAYGIGVLKSVDGGSTWSQTGLEGFGRFNTGNDIYIDPNDSNTLWVATSAGLYKTTDAGVSWVRTLSGRIKDIKLKPGDSNVIYAASPSTFYKSTNGGDSFVQVSNGLSSGTTRIVLDVTPANSEYVYALCAGVSSSFQGLYKSVDGGNSFFRTQEAKNIFESTQAYYDLALAVSDQDPNLVFVGCLNVWRSNDGGDNFSKINNWSSPGQVTYTHADIHFLRYYDGKLLCGSDGGIYESVDNGASFTDLTKGLQIGQFYKISVAENSGSDHLVGGLQDNGGYALNGSQWNVYYGADGMDCAVKGDNDNTYYGFIQYGRQLYETTNRGEDRRLVAFGPERGNWITPLVSSRNGSLYAGFSSFYKLENGAFAKQTDFDFGGGNLSVIELDPSDINIIYAAKASRLYKSIDKGVSWFVAAILPRTISAIEVHNDNNKIVYVTLQGSSNNTVYRSTDQGMSFSNISENLPNEGKFTIKHHKGTESIYVGTYLGVYHKNGDQPWVNYSAGLPNVAVRDLEVNLKDGVLLAATYGRGVWKVPLVDSGSQDNDPPSRPVGLQASAITDTSLVLSWNPAMDNVGVTTYEVYQGGSFIKSVQASTANITGLEGGTAYEFRVVAKDAAQNQSAYSDPLHVSTLARSLFTVNFYKPAYWSDTINVYLFDIATDSLLPGTAPWPGQQATNLSGTNWYTYDVVIPSGVLASDIRVIFNDGNNQTEDLVRSTDGWYQNNQWSDECLNDCDFETVLEFYFLKPLTGWGSQANLYVFDSLTNAVLPGTPDWPGQRMTTVSGSSWCKVSVVVPAGISASNIGLVFSNGNGKQTVDLRRTTTGWFRTTFFSNVTGLYDGVWSDSCMVQCANSEIYAPSIKDDLDIAIVSNAFVIPHPIRDRSRLFVNTDEKGILEVSILNIIGQEKQLFSQNVAVGNQEIEMNATAIGRSGIYFCTIRLNDKVLETLKIVIQ